MAERTEPTNPASHPFYCQYRAVYEYALGFVRDKRVLDAGCGEGYGANLLAKVARQVIAIDYDKKAIRRAARRYQKSNLIFHARDLNQLRAYEADSFDVVCCFQVIEHLKDPVGFLRDAADLLKADGVFLISTPNRLQTFVDWPYHEREYAADEFRELLEAVFPEVTLYALHASFRMHQFREIQARNVQRIFRWDIFQLRKWLPRRMLQLGFDIGGKVLGACLRSAHTALMSRITVQDFYVRYDGLDEGLDLIGVCRKNWIQFSISGQYTPNTR